MSGTSKLQPKSFVKTSNLPYYMNEKLLESKPWKREINSNNNGNVRTYQNFFNYVSFWLVHINKFRVDSQIVRNTKSFKKIIRMSNKIFKENNSAHQFFKTSYKQ